MLTKNLLVSLCLSPLALATALQPRADNASSEFSSADLSLREVGARNTLDWRIWLERNGKPISFWHDVPLWPDVAQKHIINFVVEIPRWADGKIEIKRDEPLNPIFHDERNDAPRFVESVWPHKSYPFLYGSIPQTWENPNLNHSFTGFPGDNDPIDLFDIGQDIGYTGQVKQVKVLGGLALSDGNETDWKILGVDVNDPLAPFVNSIADVEKYRPGLTETFRDWWTTYKVARGSDIVPIVGETYQNVSTMVEVLEQGHKWWAELIRAPSNANKVNYNQTSTPSANVSYVSSCVATKKFDIPATSDILPAAEKPEQYNWWYYLDGDKKLIQLPTVV